MDPLSIAAGAASLAVVVAKLVQKASDYGERISSADNNLRHLTSELTTLGTTLRSIDTVLRNTNLETAFGRATSYKEVSQHLSALQQILDDCRVSIDEFETVLSGLKASRFTSNILRKSTTAWKINQKTPTLGRIQHLITGYHRAMQIQLQLMTLLLSTETSVGLQSVDSSLDSIKNEILKLRFHLTSLNENENLDGETLTSNSIKESLTTSEHVLSSASEYFGSTAGTMRINNASPVNFSEDRAAQVQMWIKLKHEDANTFEDEDEEDVEMISEMAETAAKHYSEGNYPIAKRFFGTFLQKVDLQATWDPNEIAAARVKLAGCHAVDGELHEAHIILEKIDVTDCSEQQTLNVQQSLAEILYMKSELERAKRHAKLAVKGREKDSPLYYNSVTLLVLICAGLDQIEEAEVYKARVPKTFQAKRIPGWKIPEDDSATKDPTTNGVKGEESTNAAYPGGSDGLPILEPVHEELPSERTSTATNVTFLNRTANTKVAIYWIDWEKNAKHYVDVDAGGSSHRPTYVGHVWLVVDWKTRRLVASYVATKQDSMAIITDEMELKPLGPGSHPMPSGRSSKALTLTFVNRTTASLAILWVDWNNNPKHYATVLPGECNKRPTYSTHVWRVMESDPMNPGAIANYRAPLGDSTVTITEEQRLKAKSSSTFEERLSFQKAN